VKVGGGQNPEFVVSKCGIGLVTKLHNAAPTFFFEKMNLDHISARVFSVFLKK
jgi:hypothetical protein